VAVLIALLKSVTYGSNHDHGRLCYSGHTVVVDLATGAAMPVAAVNAMFALGNAKPGAGAIVAQGAAAMRVPAGNGGFQGRTNPEFRDLGCYAF